MTGSVRGIFTGWEAHLLVGRYAGWEVYLLVGRNTKIDVSVAFYRESVCQYRDLNEFIS